MVQLRPKSLGTFKGVPEETEGDGGGGGSSVHFAGPVTTRKFGGLATTSSFQAEGKRPLERVSVRSLDEQILLLLEDMKLVVECNRSSDFCGVSWAGASKRLHYNHSLTYLFQGVREHQAQPRGRTGIRNSGSHVHIAWNILEQDICTWRPRFDAMSARDVQYIREHTRTSGLLVHVMSRPVRPELTVGRRLLLYM